LEALFNVRAPEDGAPSSGPEVDWAQRPGWPTLATAWPDAQMTTSLIEAWLLRGSSRPTVSLAEMEELIFLHELRGLAELTERAEPAAAAEAA
jgi:hypothetical protein